MVNMEDLYDIHCHILHDVDDGARNEAEAENMLKTAYSEGIRNIFLTPHYHKRYRNVTGDELTHQFEALKKIARKVDKSLNLYLGNELYYNHDAGELLKQGTVRTMAGSNYVLVEFAPGEDFNYIRNALYNLQMEGFSPILAHMERYQSMGKRTDRVEQLIEMGIYIQANADSIMGGMGMSVKNYLRKLLGLEYIHFLGTDAHDPVERPPKMKKCAEFLQKKYDEAYVKRLLYENPQKIINDEYI